MLLLSPLHVTQIAPAAVAGADLGVTDVVTQGVHRDRSWRRGSSAGVVQAATATSAAAGVVTAIVTEIAGASAAGAAVVTDVATQGVIATIAAAGAVNANAAAATFRAPRPSQLQLRSRRRSPSALPATAAGAAAVTAKVTQAVTGAMAGAAALAVTVRQSVTAQVTAAGAVTAARVQPGGVHHRDADSRGTQAKPRSPRPGAAAALTATTAPYAAITATDQRTGGPS